MYYNICFGKKRIVPALIIKLQSLCFGWSRNREKQIEMAILDISGDILIEGLNLRACKLNMKP